MSNDPKDVRAPHTSVFGSKSGGNVSFEIYFLRDLYVKKKIDAALIRDIAKQNGLDDAHVDDAIKTIESTSGDAVPAVLSNFLRDIAIAISGAN